MEMDLNTTNEGVECNKRIYRETTFELLWRYEPSNLQQCGSSPLSSQIFTVVLPLESWTHTWNFINTTVMLIHVRNVVCEKSFCVKLMCKVYLSWEVVICPLGNEGEIRWQMWHDIMSVCHSNGVGYVFGEAWGECSIANTRLPKRHELHPVTSQFHLWINVLFKLGSRITIQKYLREHSMKF
jgi:hypothetical protein